MPNQFLNKQSYRVGFTRTTPAKNGHVLDKFILTDSERMEHLFIVQNLTEFIAAGSIFLGRNLQSIFIAKRIFAILLMELQFDQRFQFAATDPIG